MADMSFAIAAVEAFHVVARDRAYWSGLKQENRASSDRYVLKPGWRAAYGKSFETAVVKVTLADGSVGWGEATEPICPEVICRLAVHLIAPFIGDKPYDHPSDAWADAYDLQRVRGHTAGYVLHAIAAIDIAIWDALACRARVPLAGLLAEDPAKTIPAYLSGIRRGTRAERIDLLAELVGDGLTAAKIFVTGDTTESLAEIDALRAGVAGDWDLMVDALWSYETVETAIHARRAFGERDVRWLECPLIPEDIDAHHRLADAVGPPIALGEHFFTHFQSLPWFKAGVFSIFQPDIGRASLSNALHQARLAREHGIVVTPHMGSGSPIVQAAALHFWAATRPEFPCEYQFDLADTLPGVFDTAWKLTGGVFSLPARPGLGVNVNEQELIVRSEDIERWSAS